MAQLHFSVDEATARMLAERASAEGLSLSRYLAKLVGSTLPQRWPEGYLAGVVGACADDPLEVPPDVPVTPVIL